jgi:peptidoglycan/LPS O-acetylase OafA/YrhL
MGVIRFILALSVAIGHGGELFGFQMVNGLVAVEAFFIVSGFYMSMVILEKYSLHDRWIRLFWINRYLRLAPVYVIVSLAAVIGSVALNGKWATLIEHSDMATLLFVAVSAVTMIGQDIFVFFGYDLATETIHFLHNPFTGGLSSVGKWPTPGYSFLPIEPGWSIGIEAWFYLLAPFLLVLHLRWIALAIAVSVALRGWIYLKLGWGHDPWTYRFFPTELVFFLIGYIGYRVYALSRWRRAFIHCAWVLWPGLIFFGVFYAAVPYEESTKANIFIAVVAISLPAVFTLTKQWRVDRWLGELSYPIYLIHMPIFAAFAGLGTWKAPAGIALTLGLSVLAFMYIERPVDRWRGKLEKRWS